MHFHICLVAMDPRNMDPLDFNGMDLEFIPLPLRLRLIKQ